MDEEEKKQRTRERLERACARNPKFVLVGGELASMRSDAPWFLGGALVLLIAARPQPGALFVAVLAGLGCGGLQLLAAAYGRMFCLKYAQYFVTGGLIAAAWLEIGPFHFRGVDMLQSFTLVLVAMALQRAVCGYLHRFVMGGMKFFEETVEK